MTNKCYMLTIPRYPWVKAGLKAFIRQHDIHKWIIAKETGRGGYEHYQVRLTTNAGFECLKSAFPQAHIEEASEVYEYEKKEGKYWCSDDTNGILRTRYGKLDGIQRIIHNRVGRQSDRGITTVLDRRGNSGKSFYCRWLFERGKGFYCPPTVDTVKGLIQFVASGYRGEEIIVIDIPRSWKWSEQLYAAIESIKDGLVYDTRYHTQIRDIYGVKVLVLTNTVPKLDKLSIDRWDILDITDYPRIDHNKKKRGAVSMTEAPPQPPTSEV